MSKNKNECILGGLFMQNNKSNAAALLPLLAFLVLFIGTGIYLTSTGTEFAFYQLPAPVAILPAIVLAIWIGKEEINQKIDTFLKGVGDSNIITMCIIYLLAGGFASVAKAIGGVESTVNLGLSIIPASLVLPGIFMISAFISTAMGTSMGTIAAIAPIAVEVANKTDISVAITVGAVVAGAMFGDNLSMISDTTIAATKTQGCSMKDKFKFNLLIALPAAILTIIILLIMSTNGTVSNIEGYNFLKVIPYLLILIMALIGINVFVVLTAGIVITGMVGFITTQEYTLLQFSKDIYGGFTGMQEILILSLLIGGLGELIKQQGGIEFLIRVIDKITSKFSKGVNRVKVGEFGISAVVSLADICTANNTVAIIISGGIAKEIAEKNGVDPRRSASLLDIFSCVFQGLIPYGAQVLLAGSIAKISPIAIIPHIYYPIILGIAAIVAIITGFPRVKQVGM
ncbi:MAG: hypothetical protein PWP27_1469 [Clostridiales bacterium]|jgi:Na+/H+ antiporter NhaC|nr:hypothetical protein [Clostridiales bacterium]